MGEHRYAEHLTGTFAVRTGDDGGIEVKETLRGEIPVDGLRREPLRPRDSVTLRCGTQSVLLVRTGDETFCQRLQGKLRMSGE